MTAEPSVHVAAADPYARAGLEALVLRSGLLLGGPDADVVLCDGARGDGTWLALVLDEEGASAALAAGARGVLIRGADATAIGAAIRAIAAGLLVIDPALAAGVLRARPPRPAEGLTPREREVLELLASGASNKEIASELGISGHTAKFHVVAILEKLGAASRTEAVMLAARSGMLTL